MTQYYAFQTRAHMTEAAANNLTRWTGADAFAVMRTRRKRIPRKPPSASTSVTECVLKSYVFAGFEEEPNFLAISQLPGPAVYPVRFAGLIQPLNNMRDISWVTGELPKPLHRHYDVPRFAGRQRIEAGDYVEVENVGPVQVEAVDGTELVLALKFLGRNVRQSAESAQLAFVRAA
jgi:hypothetical protein